MGEISIQQRLDDIIQAAEGILQTVQGIFIDSYVNDPALWSVRRAVERELEIISESNRHIPDAMKAQDTATNWRHVADLGNILRHEYHNVSEMLLFARKSFDQTKEIE